jgi:DsbC/DsbD-like thiol-disulfide interchange protein
MFLALLLALTAFLPAPPARAGTVADVIAVELLPGWRRDDGAHLAGLRVTLAPGWRTYWRHAGSAGISPRMDWRRSRGVASVTPRWPAPRAFEGPGGLSLGYEDGFVLPLVVRPSRSGGAIRLRGRLDLGVCREVCLPVGLEVVGRLPIGGAPDPRIVDALSRGPRPSDARATCRLRPTADGLSLEGEIEMPAFGPRGAPEIVVFEPPDPEVWVTDAVVARHGRHLTATAELMPPDGRPLAIDRGRIRITVIAGDRAVEIAGCSD